MTRISIVVPTYCREKVLVETLSQLLQQQQPAAEIIVVDQSPTHDEATEIEMDRLADAGQIRWVRSPEPSIPKAMNHGLGIATSSIVLFLDDDIIADSDLVGAHCRAHREFPDASAVVGQVLQPGEVPQRILPNGVRAGLSADLKFPFYSTVGNWIANVMAGNLSVDREFAMGMGGFDENFAGAAYRFETDFAHRLISSGGRIRFCPEASIRHLRVSHGGTRAQGSHLTSADPRHGVGDYYFALQQGEGLERWTYMGKRMVREFCTRFHLAHPWYIPVKLLGEFRAFFWACRLSWQGPALLKGRDEKSAT